jgi:hypothetical protein
MFYKTYTNAVSLFCTIFPRGYFALALHFIKYDIQGCIFKMCRNFTYEFVGQRRRLKATKKIVPQKLNVILFFDIEFLKYFFRLLHEASSSWLKLFRVFRLHPVL